MADVVTDALIFNVLPRESFDLADAGEIIVERRVEFAQFLLPLAEGSEFRLAPFSAFGDLVVTTDDDTLVVVALSNVIGSLKEATEL